MRQANPTTKLSAVLLACSAMLSACGGGGGGGDPSSSSGGRMQLITFPYVGAKVDMATNTVKLTASSTSGLPVSFSSATPGVCTVSGDQLTVLTAGSECSVIASQSGGTDAKGVAWASADNISQLFVVTKAAQTIYSLTTVPDYLAAGDSYTLSPASTSGLAISSYTNTTPTVCSLNGATVTALSKGACVIGLNQAGNDVYAPVTMAAIFSIDPLVFASGYKSDGSATLENGNISTNAGSDWDSKPDWSGNWWCWDTNWCKKTVASDGSHLSFEYTPQKNDPNHAGPITWDLTQWTWVELYIGAPAAGAQTATETTLKIKLQTNTEWYDGKHLLRVQMKMGQIAGESCNIELQSDIRPASANADIWVSLKDAVDPATNLPIFSISNDCKQSGLTVESVLQSHPIAEINFRGHDSNGDNGANRTIPSPAADYPNGPAYQTKFTVGAITLQ